MRKILMTIGVSLLMVTGVYAQSITLNINNQIVKAPVAPVIQNEVTLVPLRVISENIGAQVDWDGSTQTATISGNDKEIKLVIGNKTATINGEAKTLLTAPRLIKGTTMVPLRIIGENLGTAVVWDGPTRTVIVGGDGKPVAAVDGRYYAEIPIRHIGEGAVYKGEVILIGGEETPDGHGKITMDGATMEGKIVKGFPIATWDIKMPEGIRGTAEIRDFETLDMTVSHIYPNGNAQQVTFKNGLMNGKTITTMPDGTVTEIEYKDNEPVGIVKIIAPRGFITEMDADQFFK